MHPRFCINGCALDFQERQGGGRGLPRVKYTRVQFDTDTQYNMHMHMHMHMHMCMCMFCLKRENLA